jgi:hypothetical protein
LSTFAATNPADFDFASDFSLFHLCANHIEDFKLRATLPTAALESARFDAARGALSADSPSYVVVGLDSGKYVLLSHVPPTSQVQCPGSPGGMRRAEKNLSQNNLRKRLTAALSGFLHRFCAVSLVGQLAALWACLIFTGFLIRSLEFHRGSCILSLIFIGSVPPVCWPGPRQDALFFEPHQSEGRSRQGALHRRLLLL